MDSSTSTEKRKAGQSDPMELDDTDCRIILLCFFKKNFIEYFHNTAV